MPITQQDITKLEDYINNQLAQFKAQFIMTMHFSWDRLNDSRNNPPVTIQELTDIFDKLISQHINNILVLNDGDTFNIRCSKSHINMPCAVKKDTSASATITHKNILITIMRKANFKAKDPVEFCV